MLLADGKDNQWQIWQTIVEPLKLIGMRVRQAILFVWAIMMYINLAGSAGGKISGQARYGSEGLCGSVDYQNIHLSG